MERHNNLVNPSDQPAQLLNWLPLACEIMLKFMFIYADMEFRTIYRTESNQGASIACTTN